MQKTLILYGTIGCHLCEEAEGILRSQNVPYQYVDIIDDEKLLANYQTSIPVLSRATLAGEKKIQWPFNATTLTLWLSDVD